MKMLIPRVPRYRSFENDDRRDRIHALLQALERFQSSQKIN